MPSERLLRQIDRLLDEAEEAVARGTARERSSRPWGVACRNRDQGSHCAWVTPTCERSRRLDEPLPRSVPDAREIVVTGRPTVPGLAAARFAPSAHNTQPWRFIPDERGLRLGWDRGRELRHGDPDSRYLLISLGAATESLVLGAAGQGLVGDVQFAFSPGEARAANVTFAAGTADAEDLSLAEAIQDRQTSRLPYRVDSVPIDQLGRLESQAQVDGCNLVFESNAHRIAAVAQLVAEGTARNLEDADVYKEFHAWLRLSPTHPCHDRDGLTLRSLSLGRLQSLAAPRLFPPGAMSVLRRLRVHRLLARTQGGLARRTPTFGLLVAPSGAPVDLFAGGRAMLRMWLLATRLGLRVHPMTAAMDHDDTRLALSDSFGLSGDVPLVLCFRLGYGPSGPRSPRLPEHELLVQGPAWAGRR